jgi:Tol biopolymer transport system component
MDHTIAELQRAVGDRYRVERELGAGGMATVYLAHDPRHGRQVAIKVLRPELAAIVGAERFLKEIRTTANLQHPHILPLHDSGSAEGLVYYVMPYIEGESLRQRLRREKQLPVTDALRIAREVAGGLDSAHRKGIVHRDIKPENILLHEGGGQAVIADFGIALAVSRSDSAARMTETGMSLGTPQYMSPEQAMGERDITARSDVYALGCVLYEMLVGEPPFTGHSAQAIFARILTEEPRALAGQRRTIPPHVDAAVQTALAKVPADRYASASEFAAALATPSGTISTGAEPVSRARSRVVAAAAGAALLVGTGVIASILVVPRAASVPPARLSITLPPDRAVAAGGPISVIALSPDGKTIVYPGGSPHALRLYSRRLDALEVVPIPGTDGGRFPLFSPDGRQISFIKSGRVHSLVLDGGAPLAINVPPALAALWARPNEFLLTGVNGELMWARTDGSSRVIAHPDSARSEAALLPMQLLSDDRILMTGVQADFTGPVWVLDPESGDRQLVTRAPAGLAWYHDGLMAWVDREGAIRVREWEKDRRDAVDPRKDGGAAVTELTLATGVRFPPGAPAQLWASPAGSLVYVPAQPADLVLVDRSGRERVISAAPQAFHAPAVSPDGSSIAVDITGATRDVWLLSLSDTTMTRVTFEDDGHDAMWLPDGRSILYGHSRGATSGVNRRRVDGTGGSDSVLHDGPQLRAHGLTPDGTAAYGVRTTADGALLEIVRIPLAGERRSEPLFASSFNLSHPAASPDGRWLAYVSEETGRGEVYVRGVRDSTRVLVSPDGGTEPVWSRDGRELYYRSTTAGRLVAVRFETSSRLRVRDRTALFPVVSYEEASPHANYDVTPDGRFVFIRNAPLRELVYLQNWPALARRGAR